MRQKLGGRLKRVTAFFTALVMAVMLIPTRVTAAEKGETVLVGACADFGISKSGTGYNGFAYEYLTQIKKRTGHNYVFVDGTPDELFAMLSRGEIAMIPCVTDAELESYAAVMDGNVETGFADGFPSQGEQGLMVGDRIVSIDGERIFLYSDVSIFLSMGDQAHYDVVVRRDGQRVALKQLPLSPQAYPNADGSSSVRFGLDFGQSEKATALVKLKVAGLNSLDFVRLVWYSLKMLVTGQVGLSEMSGPVGIVTTISDVGHQSGSLLAAAANIGYFASLIAINLAVMNLLPLPALDGGHIFFMYASALVTKVTKRPVNPHYEGILHYAGFIALMIFMVVVTVSDVLKLMT